jgi:hypothetical protein
VRLANCPCGSPEVRLTRRKAKNTNKVVCRSCQMRGPSNDPDGAKWNAIAERIANGDAWGRVMGVYIGRDIEPGCMEILAEERAKRGLT